jgi:two-component system, LytTR family, response regulator
MKVRTLVVEDERIPRRLLCSMVASVEWMELIGDVDRGSIAIPAIDAREPDLVFLDIRLPDASGFEVIEQATHRPAVVFTTAYDEYAIRALQLGALDYLVKPFGRQRFLETAERVRSRLSSAVPGQEHVANTPRAAIRSNRLYVRDRGIVVPVPLDRVERIEAQGDYSLVCAGARTFLVQVALGTLEPMLDPQHFLRVHRSHIVNLDHVSSFRPFDARRYVVVMRSGFELTASGAGTRLLRALVL